MFLSLWKIGIKDSRLLRIEDDYSIHRIVYSLFPKLPGKDRDFLFADKGISRGVRKIIILSERLPEKTKFGNIETKEIPQSFLDCKKYAFEITLNPVHRNGKNKKTTPIRGRENLLKWFHEKSPSWGFKVEPESLSVDKICVKNFKKAEKGNEYTFSSATFKGKLEVIDKDLFLKNFKEGIGKGKAFAFGLLQIVPLLNQEEK